MIEYEALRSQIATSKTTFCGRGGRLTAVIDEKKQQNSDEDIF
jgi:hypothetical protein